MTSEITTPTEAVDAAPARSGFANFFPLLRSLGIGIIVVIFTPPMGVLNSRSVVAG